MKIVNTDRQTDWMDDGQRVIRNFGSGELIIDIGKKKFTIHVSLSLQMLHTHFRRDNPRFREKMFKCYTIDDARLNR